MTGTTGFLLPLGGAVVVGYLFGIVFHCRRDVHGDPDHDSDHQAENYQSAQAASGRFEHRFTFKVSASDPLQCTAW